MVFCYVLLPFLELAKTTRSRVVVVLLLVGVSLLAGFDNQVGRFLSLSRLFDFLPYFAAGFYIRSSKNSLDETLVAVRVPKPVLVAVFLVFSVIGIAYVIISPTITPDVLYGASSYELAGYSISQKATLYLVAASVIAFLLVATPASRLLILSSIGTGTLSIYILHGFVIRALVACPASPFIFDEVGNLVLALLMSSVLVAVFGVRPVANIFSKYATGRWLEEIIEKRCS